LLSPHAYPEGIDPSHKPKDIQITEDWEQPTRLYKRSTESVMDPTQVFNPTISPHAYSQGVPSTIVGDVEISTSKWVGILLIDHGSKKQASNDRLDERIYQQNVDSNVIVKAAHMEIAEPSIPDGLASLLKEGVGE
jgi:hypothetical protein